jgi:hypothetical protein
MYGGNKNHHTIYLLNAHNFSWIKLPDEGMMHTEKIKLHGLSPQAKYADWATAGCQRT